MVLNFKISLDYSANQKYMSTQPAPPWGDAAHRHETLARVAMDAVASGACTRRDVRSVRRSRVVLAPRPWRQAAGKSHAV